MPRSDADQELRDLQRAMSAQGTEVAGMPSGAAVAADPEAVAAWEKRRAAQREAYGQYVAAGPIYIGNALAFNTGQPVPLEHVITYDLEGREQVNRVATPEMARLGKVFETDEEFLAANPHVARQAHALANSPDGPDPLDPRGGAARLDDERRAAEKADREAEKAKGKDDNDTGGREPGDKAEKAAPSRRSGSAAKTTQEG